MRACVHPCPWHTPAQGTAVLVSGCELIGPQPTAADPQGISTQHVVLPTWTVRALLVLLLLRGTGLTTSLQLHHTAVRGLTPERPCTIERHKTSSYLWLHLLLDRVRHAVILLWLSAVAILCGDFDKQGNQQPATMPRSCLRIRNSLRGSRGWQASATEMQVLRFWPGCSPTPPKIFGGSAMSPWPNHLLAASVVV